MSLLTGRRWQRRGGGGRGGGQWPSLSEWGAIVVTGGQTTRQKVPWLCGIIRRQQTVAPLAKKNCRRGRGVGSLLVADAAAAQLQGGRRLQAGAGQRCGVGRVPEAPTALPPDGTRGGGGGAGSLV